MRFRDSDDFPYDLTSEMLGSPVRSMYLAALAAKAQLFGCGDQIMSFSLYILIGLTKDGRVTLT